MLTDIDQIKYIDPIQDVAILLEVKINGISAVSIWLCGLPSANGELIYYGHSKWV